MRFLRKISYERKMESWLFLVLLSSLAGLPVNGNDQPSTPPLPSTMDSKHVDICILQVNNIINTFINLSYYTCTPVYCRPYISMYLNLFLMFTEDKSLFSVKRREQIETAEKVWNVDDYAKQYQAITFVVDTVFPVSRKGLQRSMFTFL